MTYSKGMVPAHGGVPGSAPMVASPDAAVATSVAREIALVKVMTDMAAQNRRDEGRCAQELMEKCGDPWFADLALYELKRGDKPFIGPSIDLAREIALIWGNCEYGLNVLEDTPDEILVEGWCRDLERVRRIAYQDRIPKLIQRKVQEGERRVTRWIRPDDEREVRDLMFRRGALVVRNAILGMVSKVTVERATRLCQETCLKAEQAALAAEKAAEEKAAASGAPKPPGKGKVASMCEQFAQHGVKPEQLAAYIGKALDALTAEDVVRLKRVYVSIEEGSSTAESHFGAVAAGPAAASPKGEPATLEDLASDSNRF